jgi:LAO/AO transport system kinase
MPSLIEELQAKRPRALAQAISLAENDPIGSAEIFSSLHPLQKSFKIGFTGPPGSGKSSLIRDLLVLASRQDLRVGVIAVDPSSPFSGGALLGDRLRMNLAGFDPEQVFIRSLSTRGHLGGLSPGTILSLHLLEYYGFDWILLETVGVGQAEVEIMHLADIVGVVLVPGMGDEIQAMKSGLMEIADLFIVNKCHRPGTDNLVGELEALLAMAPRFKEEGVWHPQILKTDALDGEGIENLWQLLLGYPTNVDFQCHRSLKRRRQIYYQTFQSVINHFRVRTANLLKLYALEEGADAADVHELAQKVIWELCRTERRSPSDKLADSSPNGGR